MTFMKLSVDVSVIHFFLFVYMSACVSMCVTVCMSCWAAVGWVFTVTSDTNKNLILPLPVDIVELLTRFESSQPLGIISGLKTNFDPSLSISAHKSFNANHRISMAQVKTFHTHTTQYFDGTTIFLQQNILKEHVICRTVDTTDHWPCRTTEMSDYATSDYWHTSDDFVVLLTHHIRRFLSDYWHLNGTTVL